MNIDIRRIADLGWATGRVRRFLEFVLALWDQTQRDRVVIRASGLAYSSLLAIVPLIAVVFALFSAFEAFDDLKEKVQEILVHQLLPTSQEVIVEYIDQFIANTRSLGFIGFVFLILTAVLLLNNIESHFNDVWHITKRRKFISRITSYTSVLVFGTILIGVSVTLSARLKAMLYTQTGLELSFLSRLGGWLFPLAASFVAFLLMFLIIPSTRVSFRSAAIGALVTSIAWEIGKSLFAMSVGQSVRYSTIYGSLATIPIFLVWLYTMWIIVLIGLEVVYTHQHLDALIRSRTLANGDSDRLASAVGLVALVAERFEAAEPPPTTDELAEHMSLPNHTVEEYASLLEDAGILRSVEESSNGTAYLPATSVDRLMVGDVVRTMFANAAEAPPSAPSLERSVAKTVSSFEAAGHEAIAETSFRDLLENVTSFSDDRPLSE